MLLFTGVDLFCGVDSVLLHTTCRNARILVAFSHHRFFVCVIIYVFFWNIHAFFGWCGFILWRGFRVTTHDMSKHANSSRVFSPQVFFFGYIYDFSWNMRAFVF